MKHIEFERRWVVLGIPAIILMAGLVVFTGLLPLLRAPLVFVFFLICPGIGFINLLNLKQPLTEFVLVVALSLSIDSVIAMILLYSGAWSYQTGFLLLSGISLLGAISLFFHVKRETNENITKSRS